MITIISSLVISAILFSLVYFVAGVSLGWSIFFALLGFGVIQALIGFLIQKRIKRDMEAVQYILLEGQKKLQAKMQRWQISPPGSMKAAQKEIFEDTKVFVKAALKETEILSKYKYFVPMIERQKATAQLQLNWMIKNFKAVDELMPKALFLDPSLSAIKMARMYTLEKPLEEIEKIYKKAVRRLRYNQNVLLASTWSWMLVKRGKDEEAQKVLNEALKSSDDKTLKANLLTLQNKCPGHFSNSALGDQWYTLYLEEPRYRTQRQHQDYR